MGAGLATPTVQGDEVNGIVLSSWKALLGTKYSSPAHRIDYLSAFLNAFVPPTMLEIGQSGEDEDDSEVLFDVFDMLIFTGMQESIKDEVNLLRAFEWFAVNNHLVDEFDNILETLNYLEVVTPQAIVSWSNLSLTRPLHSGVDLVPHSIYTKLVRVSRSFVIYLEEGGGSQDAEEEAEEEGGMELD